MLSRKQIKFLHKDLAPLKKHDTDLYDRTIDYILHGQEELVLINLEKIIGIAEAMELRAISLYNLSPIDRRSLFEGLEKKNIPIIFRILKIYEAILKNENFFHQTKECGIPFWLELLMFEGMRESYTTPFDEANIHNIDALFEHAREDSRILMKGIFLFSPQNRYYHSTFPLFRNIHGLLEKLSKYPEITIEALNQEDHKCVLHALNIVQNERVDKGPLIEKLSELAVEKRKTIRKEVHKIIVSDPKLYYSQIANFLEQGDTTQRLNAANLIIKLYEKEAEPLLKKHLKKEKSKKVIETINNFLIRQKNKNEVSEPIIDSSLLPDIPKFDISAPLSKKFYDFFKKEVDQFNMAVKNSKLPSITDLRPTISLFQRRQIYKQMQKQLKKYKPHKNLEYCYHSALSTFISNICAHLEINPIHLVRFLILTGKIEPVEDLKTSEYISFSNLAEHVILQYSKKNNIVLDLRTLKSILEQLGYRCNTIEHSVFRILRKPIFIKNMELIWPYFYENPNILRGLFGLEEIILYGDKPAEFQNYLMPRFRKTAFAIMEAFPQPPSSLLPTLWDIALGKGKSERLMAQNSLNKVADLEDKILAYLNSKNANTRIQAAEWLARLNHEAAIPKLKMALKKEKNETAKSTLINVLDKLGASIDDYLDPKRLIKEAEKFIQKGIPKHLEWFDFSSLPKQYWQENGKRIPDSLLQWLVLFTVKTDSSTPPAQVRKICQSFQQKELKELALHILNQWIAYDLIPLYTYDEATEVAKKNVASIRQWSPQANEEELFQQELASLLKLYKGSAIKGRGMLNIVAISNNEEVIPIIDNYIKDHFGKKLAHCKAFLHVLANINHPNAIQSLVAYATRFRTKSIQAEAQSIIEEIAKEKGWSSEELADRTVPTANLDDNGELKLDYGSRFFITKYNPTGKLDLFSESGKLINSLPAPNKNDNQELVKESKKFLNESRKSIRKILNIQTNRLYEAMCTQRSWTFSTLENSFFNHPIMKHLCERLIWVLEDLQEKRTLFRLMDDGSLCDEEDREIKILPKAAIKLAHSAFLSKERTSAWRAHLNDYDIKPLFEQFREQTFTLSEEDEKKDVSCQYEGYIINNYKLASEMKKWGFQKGETEDGGYFYYYVKKYPGLKLKATIEFTGSYVGLEDTPVALRHFYFEDIEQNEDSYDIFSPKIPFSAIPPVIYSETVSAIDSVAYKGKGYDPNWKKKVDW